MSKSKNARRAVKAASYLLSEADSASWESQKDDFFDAASDILDWLNAPKRTMRGVSPSMSWVDEVSAFTEKETSDLQRVHDAIELALDGESGEPETPQESATGSEAHIEVNAPEDDSQPPQGLRADGAALAIATMSRSKKRLEKEKAARPDGKRWTVYGPDKAILDPEKREFRLVIYKDEKTMEVLEEVKDLKLQKAKRLGNERGGNYLTPVKAMNLIYAAKTGFTSVGIIQPGQLGFEGTAPQTATFAAINAHPNPRLSPFLDPTFSVQRDMRRGLQS